MNLRASALLASASILAAMAATPSAALAQSSGAGSTLTTSPEQAAAPGSATTTASPNDAAATPQGEIVVTAQRRSERQVDVPISITALGPQQLQTANVQELGDISKITPSLRFDMQTAFVQPSIRGIGTGITTSGGGSNVGIYIDGFYSPNPLAADFQLTKVTSIQVLKGPQGTLFGRNTTGGAILVTTADPSETPEVDLKASYGRFGAQRYQGYATTGLLEGVAVDLEGLFTKGHSFVTNIVDNDHHVGAYRNWTIRAGLKVELSDRISVLARYTHARVNDPSGQLLNSNTDTSINPTTGQPFGVQTRTSFPGFSPPIYTTDPDQIAANAPRFIKANTDIGQVTVKADLGFANLASYSQYRKEDVNQSEDLDQTALPIFQLGLPVYDTTYSQEFLLTSKSGPRLQWTVGAFFFSNKDTYVTFVRPGSFFGAFGNNIVRLGGSSSTTQSYAGFVDATYELTDKLFLTAGVRYAHDIVKDAYYNTAFSTMQNPVPSIHSNKATPRAVLRFKPTDESSIYASYAKGYKAAIIDVGGSCQDGPAFKCNPVKPENVDAYEIGYKFDNRTFSFETAAFYYNYRNLQVSEFLGNAQAFILNAAKSEIYGLDAQANYRLGDHVQLNAGGAYVHGRYKKFGGQTVTLPDGSTTVTGAPIYATCPAVPATPAQIGACPGPLNPTSLGYDYVNTDTILRNVHMQHVPDFTGNAGARYTTGETRSGEYSLSGNVYYTTKFFFSPSGTQFKQPGYATVSLRAEWNDPSKTFSVAVFGDNVTDKRYRTQVQYNGFGIGASWSTPATWGIEVGAKF